MRYFLILLLIFFISCQSSKKIPIPFWEENSLGEFEVYYFIGNYAGKAKGFVYFGKDNFSLKILGPLNLNIFSLNIDQDSVDINYKNEVFRDQICQYIEIKSIISYFNGNKDAFPAFFSCYGWNISYDGEGGSIRGIRGEEIFFIYNTTEKPFQKFSIEYFKGDLSINGKLKGIWQSP